MGTHIDGGVVWLAGEKDGDSFELGFTPRMEMYGDFEFGFMNMRLDTQFKKGIVIEGFNRKALRQICNVIQQMIGDV